MATAEVDLKREAQRVSDELELQAERAANASTLDAGWCRISRATLEDWARRLREGR
jgi:hypothetical protein